MNSATRLVAAIAMAGIGGSRIVAGETAPTQTVATTEIVVTASMLPTATTNVTQKIAVLGKNDLDNLPVGKGNLTELLTYQPGALVTVLSRNDANWGSYGGVGPKYSTFMLDGLPIDSFVDTQALDPWALRRMEAQRGPASVLYPNYLSQDFAGNQSPLAGTVNLITPEHIAGPMTRVDAGYGSYNTYRVKGYHEDLFGPAGVFGGASYEHSDYTDYGTEDSWLHMLDNPRYSKVKVYGGAGVDLDETGSQRLSIFGNWTEHKGDVGRPNRRFDHQYSLLQGCYVASLANDATLQAKLGYRRYDRTWQEDNFSNGGDLSLASDNGVVQNIVPADVAIAFAHAAGGLLTVGGDFQTGDYRTYTDAGSRVIGNDGRSDQYGLYAQEELVLAQWILRVGGRVTRVSQNISLLGGVAPGDDSASWNKLLWSAGIRYKGWAGLSPFANVGTSFMPPSLKSAGGTLSPEDRGVAGRDGQLPNKDLDPEDGFGGDIGLDMKPGKDSVVTVRAFANKIDNAIVDNAVSATPSQSQSVNAGKTTALGMDVAIRQELTDSFHWFANYTYTQTKVRNDVDADQDDSNVPFVPDHTGNLGLTFTLSFDLTISPYLHVAGSIYDSTSKSGRREFDSYELVNLTVRKGLLRKGNRSVELYAEIYNVTNNKFEMPWQFQDPGLSVMTGLQATF